MRQDWLDHYNVLVERQRIHAEVDHAMNYGWAGALILGLVFAVLFAFWIFS